MTARPRYRLLAVMAAGLCVSTLAGCAGGGGAGSGVPTPTPTPVPVPIVPTPTPIPIPTPIPTPSTTSQEYLRNPGLAMIHPDAAWAVGATGSGELVAIIDSGVDTTSPDLVGVVSSASTDIVTSRTSPAIVDRHGTEIATVIAANFNGTGTVGVAYNASILSVRTDSPGTCTTTDGCSYNTNDLATGVDYAVAHGAKVINLSVGSDTQAPQNFQDALARAAAAGVVIVAAAGNDFDTDPVRGANPIYPAAYATDPRFQGLLIAAGALDATGTTIAPFSNRAGTAAADFLMAPGTGIWTDCMAGTCEVVSGTSFAAPHIVGALALLLSGFPNLTGAQAVQILLQTADDLGAPGVDPIYGAGRLDIAKAFQPVGSLSVAGSSGREAIAVNASGTVPAAVVGPAFGQSFTGLSNLKTVGFDNFHRMYGLDLGPVLSSISQRSPIVPSDGPVQHSTVNLDTASGAHLTLAVQEGLKPLVSTGGPDELLQSRLPNSAQVDYSAGAMRVSLWTGREGYAPNAVAAPADAFSQLAFAQQTGRVSIAHGAWTFSAEQGFGDRGDTSGVDFTSGPNTVQAQSTSYSRFAANIDRGRWGAVFGLGVLTEAGGPLGSMLSAGSAYAMPASTKYATVETHWNPMPGLTLTARGALGETHAQGAAFSLNAVSSSWGVEAATVCRFVCSGLSLGLTQPVRAENGALGAYLAEQPNAYTDPLVYSWRKVDATPGGRELDWSVSAWRNFGRSVFSLQANAFTDENNRKDMPLNLGLTASLRSSF
jgi:hypothetical protein